MSRMHGLMAASGYSLWGPWSCKLNRPLFLAFSLERTTVGQLWLLRLEYLEEVLFK